MPQQLPFFKQNMRKFMPLAVRVPLAFKSTTVLSLFYLIFLAIPRSNQTTVNEVKHLHFISFASSSIDLTELKIEASLVPLFSSVRICDESCLQNTSFWNKHGNFIQNNPRGYGYWIWKYALVLEAMTHVPENASILYADGGCALNLNGTKRLSEYPKLAKDAGGLLLFELQHSENMYTKRDTGERILPHTKDDRWGKIRAATCFLAVNSKRTRQFFEEALRIASEENYHFIDDSPSSKPESPAFKEHRHDQSIMSMLSKTNKYAFPAIPDETYPKERCLEEGFPVMAVRRKILAVT